jgi:nucleoside diphosphate kinase
MARELSYVMVNPYTIYKSRTGGVLSRLLTRTALDLAGGIMFAPGKEFVDEFASAIVTSPDEPADDRIAKERIRDYVREHYSPSADGRRNRFMALLFEGEDAVRRTRAAVGNVKGHSLSGETIRDTYGDFILNPDGSVRHFEPAVLAAPTLDDAKRQLRVLAKYADADAGLLDEVAHTHGEAGHQRTLVILKPDNFRFPSGRPGNVIDLLSRAGLSITGLKVHRMSVAEAEQFYGPVRPVLLKAFCAPTGHRAKELIVSALALPINAEIEGKLADVLGPLAAEEQFQNIVRFMTGRAPRDCTPADRAEPGSEKCIILVYEGIDAVKKIREVLGPTDPSKAPPGSIRREFGQTMMVNAAHASDSPENAERELTIVKIEQNNFKSLIQQAYGL